MRGTAAAPRHRGRRPPGRCRWRPTVFAVLVVVSWQVITHITVTPDGVPPVEFRGEWFWDGWVRYDAGWYTMIVDNGYSYTPGTQSPVAFFPRTRWLCGPSAGSSTTRPWPASPSRWRAVRAPWSCSTAGAGTGSTPGRRPRRCCAWPLPLRLLPVRRHVRRRPVPAVRWWRASCFERDHLVLAGLAGGGRHRHPAGGGGRGRRPGGRRVRASRRLRPGRGPLRACTSTGCACVTGGCCCRSAGSLAWSGWLWPATATRCSRPCRRAGASRRGPATWVKRDFFPSIIQRPERFYSMGLVIQATFGLAVAAHPAQSPAAGWRYGAYVGALVLVPAVGSQDFQGLGRYLLGRSPFALWRAPAGRAAGRPPCRAPAVGRRAGGLHRDVRQRPLYIS